MKKLITICLVVGIILAVCVPAQATLLSDLLVPGATITSGDKLFSNFKNWASTVNAADVTVSAYQNPTNFEYGLKFTSVALKLDSAGGLSASFDYIVQPTLPGYLISDNTLTMMGTGGGGIYIFETATDAADETKTLSSKMTYLVSGMGITTDHVVYTNPVAAVHVYKSITLNWAGGAGAAGPRLTEFTQTFSQVPEPATVALLGLGALSLLRRRKNS